MRLHNYSYTNIEYYYNCMNKVTYILIANDYDIIITSIHIQILSIYILKVVIIYILFK